MSKKSPFFCGTSSLDPTLRNMWKLLLSAVLNIKQSFGGGPFYIKFILMTGYFWAIGRKFKVLGNVE